MSSLLKPLRLGEEASAGYSWKNICQWTTLFEALSPLETCLSSKEREKSTNFTFDQLQLRNLAFYLPITLGSAMANEDLWPHWGTWRTIDRTLELHPTGKRLNEGSFNKTQPYSNLVKTVASTPHGVILGEISRKFRLRWEDSEEPDYGTIDNIDHALYEQELADGEL
jgi:hypothetical protein